MYHVLWNDILDCIVDGALLQEALQILCLHDVMLCYVKANSKNTTHKNMLECYCMSLVRHSNHCQKTCSCRFVFLCVKFCSPVLDACAILFWWFSDTSCFALPVPLARFRAIHTRTVDPMYACAQQQRPPSGWRSATNVRAKKLQHDLVSSCPRGSKYPNSRVSGTKNHSEYGFWNLKPYYLGTWTLWGRQRKTLRFKQGFLSRVSGFRFRGWFRFKVLGLGPG